MFKKRHAPVGSRPGTLAIAKDAPDPHIAVFHYDVEYLEEFEVSNAELLADGAADSGGHKIKNLIAQGDGVTWVDVQGLGSEKVLRKIAELFGLHPLTIADVVNVPQRPKTEYFDAYAFNVGAMVHQKPDGEFDFEQLSIIWGDHFIITFQEKVGDIFDPVRNRLRKGNGPIRRSGSDYLAYAILDTMVDAYYPLLEIVGEQLEVLEDQIITDPTEESLQDVYRIKRKLLNIRRSVWPQREAVSSLAKEQSLFVKDETRVFFRDAYEHVIQVIDVVETYRELAGSFMDVYLSSVSNKMNEVMKVLTIMGSIFIPLSFLAGVFGMNFEYMPELKWKYSYPTFWVVIIISAASLMYFFRRKGWLGSTKKKH